MCYPEGSWWFKFQIGADYQARLRFTHDYVAADAWGGERLPLPALHESLDR